MIQEIRRQKVLKRNSICFEMANLGLLIVKHIINSLFFWQLEVDDQFKISFQFKGLHAILKAGTYFKKNL
ncbi:hypothetical protein BpHYR1_052561 [Brachionus plicatilis]|uniref:Uncharacterized protein n=1 Tax=Brachionus plicatilis TaxID=10195 RepID=A0A3M7P9C1_BRAPC|nr:hypothetical protein BpHYR1_052561 [Brachionus plicatilis]